MTPHYQRLHTRSADEGHDLRLALRAQGIGYTYISASYVEVRVEDTARANVLLQQLRMERLAAEPPTVSAIRHGRLQAQTIEASNVCVDSMESLRPFLGGDNVTKAVYNRLTLVRQIAVLQAQMQHWRSEQDWLAGVAEQGGVTFQQGTLNLDLVQDDTCPLPPEWAAWAANHGGVSIKTGRRSPAQASAFIITKEHALEQADRAALSLDSCARIVESLRQQIANLQEITDPVLALEALLRKLHGYTRFTTQGSLLTGTSIPTRIGGIDMGIYGVVLDIAARIIEVNGGRYSVDGTNHPHVYLGRP